MERLTSGQTLFAGERLLSGNGWVELVVQGDGNVVLYRVQTGQALWASATDGQPVDRLVMQADGNLVALTAAGEPRWNAGTGGHPGAEATLRDDGNLVIYDPGGTPWWASDTVQDFGLPTVRTVDDRGYSYVETSERWKLLCQELPCTTALQWPGYATTTAEITINGEQVVIQLWKGWCQRFLGLPIFPGGIGAEVGVYRRIPGHVLPGSLPFLPPPLDAFYLNVLSRAADNELWWPAPDLAAQLTFSLINPVTGDIVFTAGPERSYWLAKWMNEDAYLKYLADQGFRVPFLPDAYILEWRVNGQSGRWPELPAGPAAAGDTMTAGEMLGSNGTLFSANGRFRFIYQDDTNLVLYRTTDNVAQWDTRPKPGGVGVCLMQGDGNLVVCNASAQPVWSSQTAGNPGSRLVMQDDGNAVVYRPDGEAIWSSNTAQNVPPGGPPAAGDTMSPVRC
ncbi:hypothetical protein Ahu01nite_067480 [Winogradskya humida]|uniref:Bulb-type lectin domain-containing protein n=2 Tax=Winogradskya humida TaxID=113566 RepID=A0ABQ3ZYH2_9ACTN|nr:hypothetical protein Ahu01nite_067480 [Actinoplanes humidus]